MSSSAPHTANEGYTVPPPGYSPSKAAKYGSTEGASASAPLLASGSGVAGEGLAARDAWAEEDEMEDDFKIGVTVSQSALEIRHAFVKRVYGVLFCQILATTIVGWLMRGPAAVDWTRTHPGFMMIPMFGAVVAMLGVYWKRHSSPANVLLLGIFTLLEAVTLGSVISYFDTTVVLQAFIATTFVFLGLTLFTLQSKYDFSSMGTYLYAALLCFFFVGLAGLFIPYSRGFDMLMAGFGVLLFSAYIVFDTHMLMNRLHVDDWVVACVSLYLDLLNLFLQILRLLNDSNDR
ncbi:hypothetical protein JCM8097_008134 [Rhodosporidiobolus ruineniae]